MTPPQQRGGQAADVTWLLSDEALEIGRRAVEDELVELRDARIGQLRNNGLVIKERDGSPSDIIRLGPEDALRIGLRAMLTSAPPAPSVGGWVELTDEDRERAMRSMPDMLEGFMKTWGWLHYAKAIEAICREKNALPQPPKEKP